jgi:hypothetical protein
VSSARYGGVDQSTDREMEAERANGIPNLTGVAVSESNLSKKCE